MPVIATPAGQVPGVARDRALSADTVALSASLALGPFLESLVLRVSKGVLRVSKGSLRVAILSFLPLPLAGAALLLFIVEMRPLVLSRRMPLFQPISAKTRIYARQFWRYLFIRSRS